VKRTLKQFFRSVGYEIRRVQAAPSDPDAVAAKTVKESQCYIKWSTAVPIYAGWLGDAKFGDIYCRVAQHTIVSVDRCYFLYCVALHAASLSGDFAECGVYRGGTALLLSEVAEAKKVVHIFDSFSGLPEPDENVDNYYRAGTFADTSFEDVRRLFEAHTAHIQIHRGWMPGSFSEVEQRSFALVHVDVDLYRTAKACCEFFYPRLCEGGILVFDDYGFPACRGEKEAVDEFFSTKNERPICLPTGQAFVVKKAIIETL
jgi:O-methyltransferase